MTEFFTEYGLFLAKTVTFVVAALVIIGAGVAAGQKARKSTESGHIDVKSLNEQFDEMADTLKSKVLDEHAYKEHRKAQQKLEKERLKNEKKGQGHRKKRIYVLDFDGGVEADEVEALREEVTAVLLLAEPQDEVVIKICSPGGMVHTYGLAASQLQRIKEKQIPLTVCVDKVAASGGYLMACQADRLIAAPFAILGSIGVLAQLPNFNRLLKKHDVEYEVHTAGEYKASLSMFGENTDKMREKLKEELEDTHQLFKSYVADYRPQIDIDKVATGEIWYGKRALDQNLIDEIKTSDSYLLEQRESADLFTISFEEKQTLQDRLGSLMQAVGTKIASKAWSRAQQERMYKY